MQILHEYKNGNTNVSIFDDGTLVRTFDDDKNVVVDFPSSMDVKITNFCSPTEDNPICSYCHEKSGLSGRHANINKLLDVISCLPQGVEQAIGGGAPISHPEIITYLQELRNRGIIPNITVNQKHLKQDKEKLINIITNKLAFGIGISYSDQKYLKDIEPIIEASNNVVFHVIMGINNINDIDVLYQFCSKLNKPCKILVLGYKNYGFGINHLLKNPQIEDNKYQWYIKLASYFKKKNMTISFDNLAIDQLNLKRYFTDDGWNKFFMGYDGVHTMYVDAVNQQYAKSSTSSNRASFNDMSLLQFFKTLSKNIG